MWKIPLFDLDYDDRELKAVTEVIQSRWLTSGPKTREFENAFQKFLGDDVHAIAVANCTAALHLALACLNLKKDDEVIISGLSFVAALNMVVVNNLKPILADSKSFTDWNVSVEDIKNKITPKTKAVIIVHFAGYPCDMDEICQLCEEKKLILIEDVAHAIGAEYKNQKCGTFGDIACFSFFSNKNLSVGEGGMIVTRHKKYYDDMKLLRSHGMSSMTVDRYEGRTISYDVIQPGFNYRLDEIRSALGIVQLSKLIDCNKKRKMLVEYYIENLKDCTEITVPWNTAPEYIESSYHIFPVLLPKQMDRTKLVNHLKELGIQTSIHYPAYDQFSHYRKVFDKPLTIADEISERVLTLPLYPGLTKEDIDTVCNAIISYIEDSK